MITIVIADDHEIFRQGVARLLADDERFKLVGEASNGSEAVALIRELQPQVAVLDLAMPRPDGIEVAAAVRTTGCDTKCIILTMKEEIEIVCRALDNGVTGYVLKSSGYKEISRAIIEVAAGRLSLGEFSNDPRIFSRSNDQKLSKREIEVLRLITQGLTSKQAATELFINYRTVEKHRQNIMDKLNIKTVTALAEYARQRGYI